MYSTSKLMSPARLRVMVHVSGSWVRASKAPNTTRPAYMPSQPDSQALRPARKGMAHCVMISSAAMLATRKRL